MKIVGFFGRGLATLALFLGLSCAARAQSGTIDLCTGLRLNLPVLQPVGAAASGLLAGALDPVLNGIVGDVNTNLRGALSGQSIGVSAFDQNGNLVSTPGNCNVQAHSLSVSTNGGVAIGGGIVSGLGGLTNSQASAGDANAIALGNGATTGASTAAIALGLRGSVTAADGVAIGRDATVTAAGGIALGSGSVASRNGMNGAAEAFSGSVVSSTAGAISVGAAGSERQITNVAGGTQQTDAVNVRQLRAVGGSLASALGGGAGFDATTGAFSAPGYQLRGTSFSNVGSALTALDIAVSVTAANNTSGYAVAVASGNDALSVGNGSVASGKNATAVGTGAAASDAGAVALGAGASASGAGSVAIGAGAMATRANQVAIGTVSSTYTMPGVSSAASRVAQSGATQFVTSDAAGNLATTPVDLRGMDSRISTLSESVAALNALTTAARRESRQGIAAAMSMSAASMPSAPGKTSWSGNTALYKGEWAAGFSVAHRLNVGAALAVNAGFSMNAGSFGGARVGLSGEF